MENTVNNVVKNYAKEYALVSAKEEDFINKIKEFFVIKEDSNDTTISEILKLEKQIKEQKQKLEGIQSEVAKLYATKYKEKYTGTQYTIVLKYTDVKRNPHYYSYPSGVQVQEDELPTEGIVYVNIPTKNCIISVLDGYCLEYASAIGKKYQCKVASNNSSCTLILIKEMSYGILNDIVSESSGYTYRNDSRYYGSERSKFFNETPAKEFLNLFYNLDKDFNQELKLVELIRYYNSNKSFETIVKTAPESLIKNLLTMEILECTSVPKILGVSKEIYEQSIKEGTEKSLFALRSFIKNKEVFNKTDNEWVEMMKQMKQHAEDLDFYHVNFTEGYYYYNYDNTINSSGARLLYNLAYEYQGNRLFSQYYSFGKFCDYIISETINQGYNRLSDFTRELRDYLNMCEAQSIVPTLYSSYLKQTHDITARNHKVYLEEHQEEIFKNRYKDDKIIKLSDDYMIVPPKSSKDLQKEGDTLNHCVASYIKRVIDGTCKIFFLRKKADESLITVEVRDGVIAQVRGLHNRKPTDEEATAISQYAKKKNLLCRY